MKYYTRITQRDIRNVIAMLGGSYNEDLIGQEAEEEAMEQQADVESYWRLVLGRAHHKLSEALTKEVRQLCLEFRCPDCLACGQDVNAGDGTTCKTCGGSCLDPDSAIKAMTIKVEVKGR